MPAVSYSRKFKYLVLFLPIVLGLVLAPRVYADLININTAGSTELQTLNGIGPTYAQRIIDYRNNNGPYKTIEEIKNVSGIGDATYEKIKDYITVGTVDAVNDESGNITQETQNNSVSASAPQGLDNIDKFKKVFLDVGAGKGKTAMVGTPIEFIAEIEGGKMDDFQWHFGDGALAHGEIVTHAYSYVGEYAVVLSVSDPRGADVVVARTSVRVVDPNVLVSDASPERIEITNKTGSEIDLYGRALVVGGKMFAFPRYTLILSNQKISFSSYVTALSPRNLSEVYLLTVGDNPVSSVNGVVHGERSRLEQISKIQNKISELQNSMALATQQTNSSVAQVTKEQLVIDDIVASSTQTANALSAVTPDDTQGWFAKLKRFFIRK